MTLVNRVGDKTDPYLTPQCTGKLLISNRCCSKVGYSMESNAFRGQRRNVLGSHLVVYLRTGEGEVFRVEVNENIKLGYSQDQGYLLVSGLGFGLI